MGKEIRAVMACMRKADLTEEALNQWDSANVETRCANPNCGAVIVHRPVADTDGMLKVCLPCALSLAAQGDGCEVGVHPEMEAEARAKLGDKYDTSIEQARELFGRCVEARKALDSAEHRADKS